MARPKKARCKVAHNMRWDPHLYEQVTHFARKLYVDRTAYVTAAVAERVERDRARERDMDPGNVVRRHRGTL